MVFALAALIYLRKQTLRQPGGGFVARCPSDSSLAARANLNQN
jgi:hypothetical protein